MHLIFSPFSLIMDRGVTRNYFLEGPICSNDILIKSLFRINFNFQFLIFMYIFLKPYFLHIFSLFKETNSTKKIHIFSGLSIKKYNNINTKRQSNMHTLLVKGYHIRIFLFNYSILSLVLEKKRKITETRMGYLEVRA